MSVLYQIWIYFARWLLTYKVLLIFSIFSILNLTWFVDSGYFYQIDERCPVLQRRPNVRCPSIKKSIPPQNRSVVRVVCMSDTHGAHNGLDIPNGDIFIFGGDFLNVSSKNYMNQTVEFDVWLSKLPHKHKIFVPGNHDTVLDHKLRLVEKGLVSKDIWLSNTKVLINEMITAEGISISGMPQTFLPPEIPASPKEKETLPFLLESDSEMPELLENMPGLDILVSHNPPWHIGSFKWPYEYGSKPILQYVLDNNLKLHMFGHVHEGRGVYSLKHSDTVFINTAFERRSISPCVVVDFNRNTKDIDGIYMPTSYQDQFEV